MKKLIFLLLISLASCQSAKNQYLELSKNLKVKNGYWEEDDDYPGQHFISKGRYMKGQKTGRWRTTLNGSRYQKDIYTDSVTKTRFYQSNGKLLKKGKSKTIKNANSVLWYYDGVWKYYDEKGKLSHIKIYGKDKTPDSISCQPIRGKCYRLH